MLYATAALSCARLIAGHFAWAFWENEKPHYRDGPRPDGEQWLGAWFIALPIAAIWPLVIAPWLLSKRVAVGAEAERRLHDREARIATLEKELGIK